MQGTQRQEGGVMNTRNPLTHASCYRYARSTGASRKSSFRRAWQCWRSYFGDKP